MVVVAVTVAVTVAVGWQKRTHGQFATHLPVVSPSPPPPVAVSPAAGRVRHEQGHLNTKDTDEVAIFGLPAFGLPRTVSSRRPASCARPARSRNHRRR